MPGDSRSTEGTSSQTRSAEGSSAQSEEEEEDSEQLSDEETEDIIRRKALRVMQRVQAKLKGDDFGPTRLGIEEQIERLIDQATDASNLSQMYLGFCPFW